MGFARLRLTPPGLVGIVLVAGILLTALLADWVAPSSPTAMHLQFRLRAPQWAWGTECRLGCDTLGRDMLSRVIFGARISLLVACSVVALSALIGIPVGLLAGYFGGRLDNLLMRLVDITLSIPPVLLAMVATATLGAKLQNIILALAVTLWVEFARLVRAEVMVLRAAEFITAAKALGLDDLRIILRHTLPNIVHVAIVLASLQLGITVLWEAAFSFLGLGGSTLSWGWDVAAGRQYLETAWWMSTFPGLALFLAVIGFNLFGNWIRDVLDPRQRGTF